jgi:hypothetical protein
MDNRVRRVRHTGSTGVCFLLLAVTLLFSTASAQRTEPLIVDHNCTNITWIPEAGISSAKNNLHIAYGHTSHGSQLTSGMTGLVAFANGGGRGLSLPADIFAWNEGGTGGALDLDDYAMPLDVGYYPQWVDETYAYLDSHPECNVIIWSWCGQISSKYVAGTLYSEYLDPMSQLELDYPGVTFVYMTGHVDHSADAATKAGNQVVRDYCFENNKVLYDFADIESYDPDGTFFEFANDNCDYYASASGPLLGNWAIEWQDSHTVNVDWYDCPSAHSQPLNANQKAYAAWWLWVRIAGWDIPLDAGDSGGLPAGFALDPNRPNPFNPATQITWQLPEPSPVSLNVYNVRGQLVRNLVEKNSGAGSFSVWWDGTDLNGRRVGSGVYFYRMRAGNFVQTRKMVLLR